MGPQQQMHHITQAQAAHLDEVFGDVVVLLDLAWTINSSAGLCAVTGS